MDTSTFVAQSRGKAMRMTRITVVVALFMLIGTMSCLTVDQRRDGDLTKPDPRAARSLVSDALPEIPEAQRDVVVRKLAERGLAYYFVRLAEDDYAKYRLLVGSDPYGNMVPVTELMEHLRKNEVSPDFR
jgi:hypothetical protein